MHPLCPLFIEILPRPCEDGYEIETLPLFLRKTTVCRSQMFAPPGLYSLFASPLASTQWSLVFLGSTKKQQK